MEINQEEYKALKEMFDILQQVEVKGVNNIHYFSACIFSFADHPSKYRWKKIRRIITKKEEK